MVKYVVLLRRGQDVSHEEFLRHWRDVHAPLILKLPGLRRVSLHPVVPAPGYSPPFDGLGELWFDSVEGALAAFNTEEGRATRADTPTFADSTAAVRLFVGDDWFSQEPG